MALTGRYDFKKTLTGKVVLRVEEEVRSFWGWRGERPLKKRWRNATLIDLTSTELRTLIDARFKPYLLVHRLDMERMAEAAAKVVPLQSPSLPEVAAVPPAPAPDAAPARVH